MRPHHIVTALVLTLLSSDSSLLLAEDWVAPIQNKPLGVHAKLRVIHKGLDFGAFKKAFQGEPCLVVRVRNGHHKMGAKSISIPLLDSPATVQVQRIDIAKPVAVILQQNDGAHLFDSFVSEKQTYQIFYRIKNGQLDPNISVSEQRELK